MTVRRVSSISPDARSIPVVVTDEGDILEGSPGGYHSQIVRRLLDTGYSKEDIRFLLYYSKFRGYVWPEDRAISWTPVSEKTESILISSFNVKWVGTVDTLNTEADESSMKDKHIRAFESIVGGTPVSQVLNETIGAKSWAEVFPGRSLDLQSGKWNDYDHTNDDLYKRISPFGFKEGSLQFSPYIESDFTLFNSGFKKDKDLNPGGKTGEWIGKINTPAGDVAVIWREPSAHQEFEFGTIIVKNRTDAEKIESLFVKG